MSDTVNPYETVEETMRRVLGDAFDYNAGLTHEQVTALVREEAKVAQARDKADREAREAGTPPPAPPPPDPSDVVGQRRAEAARIRQAEAEDAQLEADARTWIDANRPELGGHADLTRDEVIRFAGMDEESLREAARADSLEENIKAAYAESTHDKGGQEWLRQQERKEAEQRRLRGPEHERGGES